MRIIPRLLLAVLAFTFPCLMQAQLSMEELHDKMFRREYDIRWTKRTAEKYHEYNKSRGGSTSLMEYREYSPVHLSSEGIDVTVEPIVYAVYNYDKQQMWTTTIGLIVTASNKKGDVVKQHYYGSRSPGSEDKLLNPQFDMQKVSMRGKGRLWLETRTLLPEAYKEGMFLALGFELDYDMFKYRRKMKNVSLSLEKMPQPFLFNAEMDTEKFKGYVQGGKGMVKHKSRQVTKIYSPTGELVDSLVVEEPESIH